MRADRLLPRFSCLTLPRPGPTGLIEINTPDDRSPVLMTGNHLHTQEVITSILSTTRSSFFLLLVDTRGDTVDMAVILRSLTADVIGEAINGSGILERTSHQKIIVPGLAWAILGDLKAAMGLDFVLGPICGGELPLFFGDKWLPPLSREHVR
jgi:acetyl-CoA decarbonylase/synthase complex subunit gamma